MTGKETSRRRFLKKTAIGGAAVVVTAGVAKKVVDLAFELDSKDSDKQYMSKGDRALSERQYVEMSQAEKNSQVKMFIDNYKHDVA
jgi:hypothetical protein